MEGNQNQAELGQNTTNQGQTQQQMPGQFPQTGQVAQQPSQAYPQQVQVPQAQPMQVDPQPTQPPKRIISKPTLIILIFLVLAVILTLIIYTTLINRDTEVAPVPLPVVPTATPVPMTDEEQLESIDVGDIDSDLQEIEADLNNL